jgi:hypothetical protein
MEYRHTYEVRKQRADSIDYVANEAKMRHILFKYFCYTKIVVYAFEVFLLHKNCSLCFRSIFVTQKL